jgi:hypothetical protein
MRSVAALIAARKYVAQNKGKIIHREINDAVQPLQGDLAGLRFQRVDFFMWKLGSTKPDGWVG